MQLSQQLDMNALNTRSFRHVRLCVCVCAVHLQFSLFVPFSRKMCVIMFRLFSVPLSLSLSPCVSFSRYTHCFLHCLVFHISTSNVINEVVEHSTCFLVLGIAIQKISSRNNSNSDKNK